MATNAATHQRIGSKALIAVWLLLVLIGAQGLWLRFVSGHQPAAYGSYVTWGLWVATYIYFAGISAGAYLLTSLVYVGKLRRFERFAPLGLFVAAITMMLALIAILVDLGHMGRFYYIFFRPNFSSMMAWMVWLYAAYTVLVLAQLRLALRPRLVEHSRDAGVRGRVARFLLAGRTDAAPEQLDADKRKLRLLAALGIPLVVTFSGGVGALFATVVAQPYWHTALYPIFFLTGAVVSGGALLLAAIAFLWPERDEALQSAIGSLASLVLAVLLFDLMLEWAEFSVAMWYGIGHQNAMMSRVLWGPYWYVFWVFHILIGSLIPIGILARHRRSSFALGIGGLLVAGAFMAVRLNIVIPALVEPQLKGLEEAYYDKRLVFEYLPTWFEWQVVFFVLAAGIALFYVGCRLLPVLNSSQFGESNEPRQH
ncbi:MAG: NrfD/PsrC family molybdoenzyme membrane anchor subunit [Armatimonadota bacterium]